LAVEEGHLAKEPGPTLEPNALVEDDDAHAREEHDQPIVRLAHTDHLELLVAAHVAYDAERGEPLEIGGHHAAGEEILVDMILLWRERHEPLREEPPGIVGIEHQVESIPTER